jgi:hypothetical protein
MGAAKGEQWPSLILWAQLLATPRVVLLAPLALWYSTFQLALCDETVRRQFGARYQAESPSLRRSAS